MLSAASRCAARGGDEAGIYQVEEVSRGRVRDRSDEMRSVMMRGRSPCLEFRGVKGTLGCQTAGFARSPGQSSGCPEQSLLGMRGH